MTEGNNEANFIPLLMGDWTLLPPDQGGNLVARIDGEEYVLLAPMEESSPLHRLLGMMLLLMQAMYRSSAEIVQNGDEIPEEHQQMMGILHWAWNEALDEAATRDSQEADGPGPRVSLRPSENGEAQTVLERGGKPP